MHRATCTAAMHRALLATVVWGATLALPASSVATSDLPAFLKRTEQMATFTHPVRADIRIVHGDRTDRAVVIIDPAVNREFLALESTGWRALMPLDWGNGKAAESSAGSIRAFNADQPLPNTDLRPMDFFPFWRGDYGTAFISDATRLEKTVTLYAGHGVPYVLFVITFGKEKLVPLTIKFYKDNVNNLVRLRDDSDFAMVGSRPRPRHVQIQDFPENSTTKLNLAWQTLEQVPAGLMDESAFQKAEIDWPSDTAAPAATTK